MRIGESSTYYRMCQSSIFKLYGNIAKFPLSVILKVKSQIYPNIWADPKV